MSEYAMVLEKVKVCLVSGAMTSGKRELAGYVIDGEGDLTFLKTWDEPLEKADLNQNGEALWDYVEVTRDNVAEHWNFAEDGSLSKFVGGYKHQSKSWKGMRLCIRKAMASGGTMELRFERAVV